MDIALLEDKAYSASELLKVLANENRLLIVCHLLQQDMSVNEMQEKIGIRQSALSQHLAILRREGIVRTQRRSQFIYYSLASSEARKVLQTLYNIFCRDKN
jgi:DNA-binding transcriptional ArsR family regulator